MKKLVSMLLIVGIIASLFTCMSVSAATVEPAYVFKAGTNDTGHSTPDEKTILSTTTYDGKQVICIDSTESTKGYTQADFKFDSNFNRNAVYYLKMKYRIDSTATVSERTDGVQAGLASAPGDWLYPYGKVATNNITAQSQWMTSDVTKTNASTNTNDTFRVIFNSVKGKVYIEYIALFDNADDATSYDEAPLELPYVIKAGTNDTGHSTPDEETILSTTTYDGKQVICIDSTESTKGYTQADFKLDRRFNRNAVYYLKMKYRIDSTATVSERTDGVQAGLASAPGDWLYPYGKVATNNITAQSQWMTSNVTKTNASTNTSDTFRVIFNSVKGKVYIEYIALFDNADDAEKYGEAPFPTVTVNDAKATTDKNAKTVEYTFAPLASADDMKSATYGISDEFEMGDFTDVSDEKYNAVTAKLTDKSDSTNVYTLTVKSRKYYDVLDVIDFTNSDNASKIVAGTNNSTTGTTTVGNTTAAYIYREADRSATYGIGGVDNWSVVKYDTSKVDATKDVWVKIAYRFGDDVIGANGDNQKRFHVWFNNKEQIIEYYQDADRIAELAKGWNTAVVKMPAGSAGQEFDIGTFCIHGKILFKYIAFFETEADAKNYKFGDIGATISTDGKTVNAIYDNLEGTNGSRILALYQGDELKKVVYSTSNDEISATDLDAGTYTAKAFYWNNLEEGYPNFDGTTETVTIN